MCASSFTATSHLNIHILFHTGVKPFSCQQCEYKCTTNGDLKKHTLTHSGEKPFTCMQCQFFCTTASDLKRHIAHPYTGRAVSLRHQNTQIQSIRCLIPLLVFNMLLFRILCQTLCTQTLEHPSGDFLHTFLVAFAYKSLVQTFPDTPDSMHLFLAAKDKITHNFF